MLRALGEETIQSYDLSGLTSVYTNAAPMPQELKIWLLEMLPSISLYEMYGSTEAGIVTCLRPDDQLRKVRCVGPAWLMNEVRIVDPAGRSVAAGQPGVLWSRSPYVFRGYLKDDEATAAATSPDGFVTAGDIAVIDEDNCVYIVDRVSDMILTGGMNVSPSEIEVVLAEHPSVADVAVVGVPDDAWGERVVAVVVRGGKSPLSSDPPLDSEALLAHARERLAGYKMPKDVYFVDSLPRNAAGKMLRREIREQIKRLA
jgi:acyl-CoA synthetase (AMP-forming)/AMP-acid ligase II